ncbi:ParA family protein [Nostoc flagelliforme FACHB-838]|uniref:ParA family protein n=1 Tax=Nostoc flagelliforme FACHB-838 TaxID=2692904 RepID=A0ABR8DZI0_9NOSO|nr:ParA family protein [Nostoc flagelliforme FACHB-838]
MLIITAASLAGGQGKTTSSFFLARALAKKKYKVLMVDADPQSSLTFYLGHEVELNQPTLLEVLKKQVSIFDGIYESNYSNLWLIPSDDGLETIQDYLSTTAMGELVLKKRLKEVSDTFDVCLVDSPPQRTQICLTTVVAADELLIPVEASSKGLHSLMRTLNLVEELKSVDAFEGAILGILPFRDRWVGRTQAKRSEASIQDMHEVGQGLDVFPSILESERYKQAIDTGRTLEELGHSNLELPFNKLIEVLERKWLKNKNNPLTQTVG